MLKATGYVTLISIDKALFKKRFKEDMHKAITDGTKAWLQAAHNRVPVLTGMAKGSLLDVAEVSDTHLVIMPRVKKNRISKGRALGTVTPKYGPRIYSMMIKSKVPHYVYLEHEAGNSPTSPWESFDAGERAFKEHKPKLRPPPTSLTKVTF